MRIIRKEDQEAVQRHHESLLQPSSVMVPALCQLKFIQLQRSTEFCSEDTGLQGRCTCYPAVGARGLHPHQQKRGLLTALKGMPDMTMRCSKAKSHVCFCAKLTLKLSTLPDPVRVCCEPELRLLSSSGQRSVGRYTGCLVD